MKLLEKYNIPVPRYTSYPTVPFWENTPDINQWKNLVKKSFQISNSENGISLYIHLPYCESLCTYCACNTRITVNHAVETPYIQALLKEWDLYLNIFSELPLIKEIHLGGGTPTFFSAVNLKFLIQGILEKSKQCYNSVFSFEAHPANTTDEHLSTLYELGFKRISFGIQDFNDKVQEAINRYQTFEEVYNLVEQCRKTGYESVNFDLVYGLPFQTQDSISDTIEKVIKLKPDRIAFYSYAHVPWLKPGQRKFTEKDLPVDEDKRLLYETGKNYFLQNNYVEIGMDHFSLTSDTLFKTSQSGSLHRNFMGYTDNYTRLLIGLGVSAISDTWTGFNQNIKTVEEYLECLNKNKLPLFKGHVLNEEDLLIRKHILNLMCRYQTTLNESEMQETIFKEAFERLKILQDDDLIQISENFIEVTLKGKPFLRNICMCFDTRYWKKTPETKLFSSAV